MVVIYPRNFFLHYSKMPPHQVHEYVDCKPIFYLLLVSLIIFILPICKILYYTFNISTSIALNFLFNTSKFLINLSFDSVYLVLTHIKSCAKPESPPFLLAVEK